MHDLDETLGDLHSIICDQEIEIVQKLCESILESSKEILEMVDAIAELDAYLVIFEFEKHGQTNLGKKCETSSLLSLTKAAKKYNLIRPVMTDDGSIEIKGGR
jgi:DNA mismatch repair ATPase MutS